MTSRERVLAAIDHREPDLVPFNVRPRQDECAPMLQQLGAEPPTWLLSLIADTQ